MDEVLLRRGRARPVWAGHPDVLSGAVEAVSGSPAAGDVVLVRDHDARPVGRGFYSPTSPVSVRMLTREPEEEIDRAFFDRRAVHAAALRRRLGLPSAATTVFRAVHGAGDGLPGVAADVFGDWLVLEVGNRGMERRLPDLAAALAAAFGARGVRAARPGSFARAEALQGPEGDLGPEPVPAEVDVREHGVRFVVDTVAGQKTGHFADHRDNRAAFARLAGGVRVLDAFCGTGGFALAAALAGAERVTAVDSSARALECAARNAALNGVADRIDFVREDAFKYLRRVERDGVRYGAIVLDPPRMASRRAEIRGALRGYKELNLRAMRILEAGGLLASASCTGVLPEEAFGEVLRDAALDARRGLTVFFRGGQGADHPFPAAAPEGRYLKFWMGRVD